MTTTPSTQISGQSPIDWLLGELHGMFGNPFIDKFRSGHAVTDCETGEVYDTGITNMKRVWAEKIRAHGMRLGDIKRGLAVAEGLTFPPSWGEFVKLCVPQGVEPLRA